MNIKIDESTNLDELKKDLSKYNFTELQLTKSLKDLLNILGIDY